MAHGYSAARRNLEAQVEHLKALPFGYQDMSAQAQDVQQTVLKVSTIA